MSTPKPESGVPSLYEWAGGMPAFERLTEIFYQRVKDDLVLAPLFARISPEHSSHVAQFIAEVFGGPKGYSARGGHPEMVRHHLGKLLTEPQRRRWAAMIVECADEANLPKDPEFRSAFVAYIEWGSRLAVVNSEAGATVDENAAMPAWGWGVPGGPYRPPS
jgi:hemoglobin